MKSCTILFFLILVFGCKNNSKGETNSIVAKKEKTTTVKNDTSKIINEIVLRESFVDSTNIGVKGKNKIELNSYNNMDSTYVEIKFSVKENNHWLQKQKIVLPKDGVV